MPSKLDQLKQWTVVTADSGDIGAIAQYKPQDCTTNPSLILKAAGMPAHQELVEEAVLWGRSHGATTSRITQRLAVNFGAALTKLVPGRVSTEVDADLSFDTEGTINQAREIISDYHQRGVGRERVLIKIAATWEGIQAAADPAEGRHRLQSHADFLAGAGGGRGGSRRDAHLALRRPHSRLACEEQRRDLYGRDRPRRALGQADLRLLQSLWRKHDCDGRVVPQPG